MPALLPHVWLMEIHPPLPDTTVPRLRFRLVGSHVDLGFGDAKTGRWLDEIEPNFNGTPTIHAAYVGACAGIPNHPRAPPRFPFTRNAKIGRASCRERVCQNV